jgi:osmotically inducible protein OsmC
MPKDLRIHGSIGMKIVRSASVAWQGGIKTGKGEITTQSGALRAYPYGYASRFEGTPGTNPEELLAAAHAGCITMALSLFLSEAELVPEQLDTQAKVTLEQNANGFAIAGVALTLRAKISGATAQQFDAIAARVKAQCPVSKLFNAPITLQATLT